MGHLDSRSTPIHINATENGDAPAVILEMTRILGNTSRSTRSRYQDARPLRIPVGHEACILRTIIPESDLRPTAEDETRGCECFTAASRQRPCTNHLTLPTVNILLHRVALEMSLGSLSVRPAAPLLYSHPSRPHTRDAWDVLCPDTPC